MTAAQDFLAAIKAGNIAEVTRRLDVEPALVNARDEQGLSAVLTAAYYQEPGIARLLVQRGAELSVFEACTVGELPRVKALVEQQPDSINAYAPDGFQPLGLAAFFGQTGIVEFLLSKGAEVNSPSRNAMRVMPLHSAIANKQTEIARRLLDHGADVDATQADDFTPLHEAAQNGLLDVTQWLLERGANVNPRLSSSGKTPLALAIEHQHGTVAQLLKQHGAVEFPHGISQRRAHCITLPVLHQRTGVFEAGSSRQVCNRRRECRILNVVLLNVLGQRDHLHIPGPGLVKHRQVLPLDCDRAHEPGDKH